MRTLSLLSLFAAGCGTPSEPTLADGGLQAKVSNVALGDHTLASEQVFRLSSGACPTTNVGDTTNFWAVSPLFPGSSGILQRSCRAVWNGPANPNVSLLPANAVPEAVVVGPLSGPAFPTDTNLADHTRSRTAPFTTLPTWPANQLKARLAILDAMGDGPLDTAYFSASPAFSDHGQRVSTIAHGITCDDAGLCPVELQGYSTLQYRYDDTNARAERALGGEGAVGSQSDLAQAIYRAVREWKDDREAPAVVGPLVISISSGWHGTWGGDEPVSAFDPNVRAVFDALGYASCNGALVFAAAGNLGGLTGDTPGPLYPAAWEREPAASASYCQSNFNVTPPSGSADHKRLIYAVGGVVPDHAPLGMSRPGSVPSLVAAGSVVAFENPSTGDLMKPMSGTSASTAVVAATAALVRSYKPTLNAHQTADKLRDGASAAGWTGDVPAFCPAGGAPCQATHVITPCHALTAACAGSACAVNGGHCDADPTLVELEATTPTTTVDWDPTSSATGSCLQTHIDPSYPTGSANLASECPIKELDGVTARPLTLPMPPSDPCLPHCELFLSTKPTFHFSIGDLPISDSSIIVTFDSKLKKTFEVGALFKDDVITLKDVGSLFNGVDPVVTATFTYSYKGTQTAGATELLLIRE